MTDLKKTVDEIVKSKNEIIRAERKKLDAAEWSNRILSAYIAYLASSRELRIKKEDVRRLLGSFRAVVSCTEDSYLIKLEQTNRDEAEEREKSG